MHANHPSPSALELGAKLGAIIEDKQARADLVENPEQVLGAIGARTDLTILADTVDQVHLVIPAQVDEARVAANDESYFEELGRLALSCCLYEILPD